MKRAFCSILFLAALSTAAMARPTPIFPKSEIGKNTDNYTGTIWLNEFTLPDSIFTFNLAQAVYAPGSKLDWHIHPSGQYQLITEGTGYYEEGANQSKSCRKAMSSNVFPAWSTGTVQRRIEACVVWCHTYEKRKTMWLKRVTTEEYKSAKK